MPRRVKIVHIRNKPSSLGCCQSSPPLSAVVHSAHKRTSSQESMCGQSWIRASDEFRSHSILSR